MKMFTENSSLFPNSEDWLWIPTSKNKKFSYSDRIFFSDKITEMPKLASMLVASRNEDIDHDSDEIISYVVFRIKIKSTAVPIKLIKDPNFENGYYSFESIPPRVITPFQKTHLSLEGKVIKIENYAKQPK